MSILSSNSQKTAENAAPPSSNTGGNLVTLSESPVFDVKNIQKSKIDFLSFTSKTSITKLVQDFSFVIRDLVVVPMSGGWQGYPNAAQLTRSGENVGLVAWGAKNHGRNYLSVSGAGCKHWNEWQIDLIQQILRDNEARITRIDLALDFYAGEITYENAEEALKNGEFKMKKGGRNPSVDRHGSEGHYGNKGRTLYVGAPKASKRICIYEKGLEQFGRLPAKWLEDQTEETVASHRLDGSVGIAGDISVKDWLRCEVRYGNDDFDLDLNGHEIVKNRDQYFAGAYPFCARVLGMTDGLRPLRLLSETECEIEKMICNARDSYGSLIHSLRKLGKTESEIIELLDSGFHSKKLVKAGYFNHLENIVPF